MKDQMILYTPYFKTSSARRQKELDKCVQKNVECGDFEKVVLLIDDGSDAPIQNEKIEVVRVAGRPTYRDWLELSSKRGPHISVLANSDIYFNDSVSRLHEVLSDERAFLALSRWEETDDDLVPHPNPHWSQDVWGIRVTGSIPVGVLKGVDIPLGVPRCDNKVAYVFAVHGFHIKNPHGVVLTAHVHESQERGYDKKKDLSILGGVAYVHPTTDVAETSDLEFDVWSLSISNVSRTGLNKSLVKWHGDEIVAELKQREFFSHELRARAPQNAQETGAANGTLIYSYLDRFQVWKRESGFMVRDNLWKHERNVDEPLVAVFDEEGNLAPEMVLAFGPEWNAIPQFKVSDQPRNSSDVYFWQYPCITEKQAYMNLRSKNGGLPYTLNGRVFELYLPIPWATLIDKKADIARVLRTMSFGVAGFKAFLDRNGYELRVHTTCQHIHWRRYVNHMRNIGVTHLSASHLEQADLAGSHGLHLSGWPLYAINVENGDRCRGLDRGRPQKDRTLLASFIGAYRQNYRSSARKLLEEEVHRDGGSDVRVELNSEWHFEKVVYGEQVAGDSISCSTQQESLERAWSYNAILSDSKFSLCPDGTGPNTLRLWESLAVGAIPVVISEGWVPPRLPGSDIQLEDACIFVRESEIKGLLKRLREMPEEERNERQAISLKLYQAFSAMTPIGEKVPIVQPQMNRSVAVTLGKFSPGYVWPNPAFPFREYYASRFGRVFIIENIVHNFEWLSKWRGQIRDTDIFLVLLGWHHDEGLIRESRQVIDYLGLDIGKFLILFNCEEDQQDFTRYGFSGEVVAQNAWLDEDKVMKPLSVNKQFDAIYVGRRSEMKRHWLASKVSNLALIAGNNHGNKIVPLPPHTFLNDKPLRPDEVCRKINEAHCGLILSAVEGACFASSEYLLCGVPVVSTKSKGGRHIWYDSYNSIVCEDDPEAISSAVNEFILNPRDPYRIRQAHITQAGIYRKRFIALLAGLFRELGDIETDATAYFREHFVHKMRKSVRPDFESIFGRAG